MFRYKSIILIFKGYIDFIFFLISMYKLIFVRLVDVISFDIFLSELVVRYLIMVGVRFFIFFFLWSIVCVSNFFVILK